jgi:hypothetical protein
LVLPAENDIEALALPAVADSADGAPGVPYGIAVSAPDDTPDPAALTARSRTEYDDAFVSPVTRIGDAVVPVVRVTKSPPFSEYWYVVMALPPVLPLVPKAIDIWLSPAVSATPVGAPGVVYGVAVSVLDPVPTPAAFSACSLIPYAVPFASPVIVMAVEPDIHVVDLVYELPLLVEYQYAVMALPFVVGGVNDMISEVSPDTDERPVGASGTVNGVPVTVSDAAPSPAEFTAFSFTLYVCAFVKPYNITDEPVCAGSSVAYVVAESNKYL